MQQQLELEKVISVCWLTLAVNVVVLHRAIHSYTFALLLTEFEATL